MRVFRSKKRLVVPGALALTSVAIPALSQEVQVEEIIVTAQKRVQNLSEVPAAVSVIMGSELQSSFINNAESLQQVVPTMTFKKGTTNVNSTLSIRGIGTQSFASGAEPSVATVVDGVVMGRAGMAFSEFTDIQQVEVLQGPQGTLFGKNASAGVVNMTTRGPTPELGGEGSIAYFDHGEYKASARASGPINDKIGFSIAAIYGDYRGNIKNTFNDTWTDGYRREGIRGKLVFDIT